MEQLNSLIKDVLHWQYLRLPTSSSATIFKLPFFYMSDAFNVAPNKNCPTLFSLIWKLPRLLSGPFWVNMSQLCRFWIKFSPKISSIGLLWSVEVKFIKKYLLPKIAKQIQKSLKRFRYFVNVCPWQHASGSLKARTQRINDEA